jgi:hypothetical protein
MGREGTRNIEIARVGATQVNEFEYHKNQGEITEQEHAGQQRKTDKPMSRAEQVAAITAAAHRKVEQKRKKAGIKTTRKISAKKSVKSSKKRR